MILILSSSKDRTTQEVCKWLSHYKKNFLVLHEEDRLAITSITNNSVLLNVIDRDISFKLEGCTSYWYRRDNFSIVGNVNLINTDLEKFVQTNIGSDLRTATEYLHFILLRKKSIASIFNANVNKLNILKMAQDSGLKTPSFLMTGSKKELAHFKTEHGQVIFKTPSPGIQNTFNDLSVSSLTKVLTDEIYEALPKHFGLTFFQQQIHKKFEIRTFFLAGKCYSLALISQKNEKTKVDYRNYDREFPNRNVPFKLNKAVTEKLKSLISKLNLDTCSIDWMYTEKGELYFLEINPVGQFGNVSFHRNDFLEKEIALFLN